MTDARDEISRIIADAEQAAYERGWKDAMAAVEESFRQLQERVDAQVAALVAPTAARKITPRRTGRPASSAIGIVADCIRATPGMKGVDVVKAAQSVDASIKERTVRTCLRRLRIGKSIWKRNDLWYPKAKAEEKAEDKDQLLFDAVTAKAA